MRNWAFGADHKRVLIHIFQHPRTTLREISQAVGVDERRTLSIVWQLRAIGSVDRWREDRQGRYRFNLRWLFDHPAEGSDHA